MRITDKYILFWDGIYSNWYPCTFVVDGIEYNCAEQHFMAEKARLFGDNDSLLKIMEADHPAEQKRLGRKVKNFNPDLWNLAAIPLVTKGVYAKFDQNKDLKEQILATGDKIFVEASPVDCVWGIGLHFSDPLCDDEKNWKGTNWLGIVLNKVRDNLRKV